MDLAEFLATRDVTESSRREYGRVLRSLQEKVGKPLEKMTKTDAIALAPSLRKTPGGVQYCRVLRVFLRVADRDDLLKPLAMKQRLPKLEPDAILTLAEVQAMVDASPIVRDKALIACLWETGVRVHELLNVRLKQVHIETSPENGGRKIGRLWFPKTKTAGQQHEGFLVDAAPFVEAWLRVHPNRTPEAPLFPGTNGSPLERSRVLEIVKATARRAGITKRVYNHLFRHSRATYLLATGKMNEAQVKALLGWAPGSLMLSRYSHLASKDAYGALMRAHGLKMETVTFEGLRFDEAKMTGAIPMPPPGAPPDRIAVFQGQGPDRSLVAVDQAFMAFLRGMMDDPEMQQLVDRFKEKVNAALGTAKRASDDAAAEAHLKAVLDPPGR